VHGWFDLSCRVAAYRTSVKVREKVQQARRRGPHERIDHDGRMRQEAVTERSRQHALHATGKKGMKRMSEEGKNSNPIQSNPIQSNPIQSNLI